MKTKKEFKVHKGECDITCSCNIFEKMSTPQHAPAPLQFIEGALENGAELNGLTTGECFKLHSLAVRAVNSHGELLATLKLWVHAFEDNTEVKQGLLYQNSVIAIAKVEDSPDVWRAEEE